MVDVLVNNAGIVSNNKASDTSPEEWREIYSVNLDGALGTAYSTSKGALISLTYSLAVELVPFGITVNGIAPAYVRTPYGNGKTFPGTTECSHQKNTGKKIV